MRWNGCMALLAHHVVLRVWFLLLAAAHRYYGFDPHDDSDNLRIHNNVVYNNGKHPPCALSSTVRCASFFRPWPFRVECGRKTLAFGCLLAITVDAILDPKLPEHDLCSRKDL